MQTPRGGSLDANHAMAQSQGWRTFTVHQESLDCLLARAHDAHAMGCHLRNGQQGGNSIDKILSPSFGPSLCPRSFFEKATCMNWNF